MPKKSKNGRKGNKGGNTTLHLVAQSSQVVGKALVNAPQMDFVNKPINWRLTQSPPRNFLSIPHWVQGKVNFSVTLSNTVPVESNQQFNLGQVTDLVGLAGFFDQYCIWAVTVSISPLFEGAGSALYSFGTCVTAIDYDNISNVGAQAAVLAFGTAVVSELNVDSSIQRVIQPTVAPALYTSGASFSGYGVERAWVDSSVTTVPHYGLRAIFNGNTVSGCMVAFDVNYVFGFRNNM